MSTFRRVIDPAGAVARGVLPPTHPGVSTGGGVS